jgi:hypothetical protein
VGDTYTVGVCGESIFIVQPARANPTNTNGVQVHSFNFIILL